VVKVFRCRVESSSTTKDNWVANIIGFCCTSHRSKADVKLKFTLRPLTMDLFFICVANVIVLKEVWTKWSNFNDFLALLCFHTAGMPLTFNSTKLGRS
jgi:hypothetical protein